MKSTFSFFLLDFPGTIMFFFTYLLYDTFNYTGHYASLDLLSAIRVLRMFKLINYHPRLKVLATVMAYSSSLLNLTMFFCILAMLIAGSSLYYAERLSNASSSEVISIIDGIWLALSTITTIGFGDI